MRKINYSLLLLSLLIILFNACSTKVDLYADYKDITVVYGLLDSNKDTNYVKINKAFMGPWDPSIAIPEDSCDYPNKLDVKLIEYRSNTMSNNFQKQREIILDTTTIHNKEVGIFYAPDQLVYFTTENIKSNTEQYDYRYQLEINRGDTILTAITDMVGGPAFAMYQAALPFATAVSESGQVTWTPCPNASIYEVVINFNFMEVTFGGDSIPRSMTWSLGSHPTSLLEMQGDKFVLSYKTKTFYVTLESYLNKIGTFDSNTGNNSSDIKERLIFEPSLNVKIAAGGYELYNFISVNGPSSSIVQNIPEYTNVNGGYGIFSSRTILSKNMKLGGNTLMELSNDHPWLFRQAR